MDNSLPFLPSQPKGRHRVPAWTIRKCQQCGKEFQAYIRHVERGLAVFCSRTCKGKAPCNRPDMSGPNNPNWKDGISKNHYHYKKIQTARYPERIAARKAVFEAVRSGRLIRQACERCGDYPGHAHHEDYSKPLDVRWLCRSCHREYHEK